MIRWWYTFNIIKILKETNNIFLKIPYIKKIQNMPFNFQESLSHKLLTGTVTLPLSYADFSKKKHLMI
jgi:hypothetical protein